VVAINDTRTSQKHTLFSTDTYFVNTQTQNIIICTNGVYLLNHILHHAVTCYMKSCC